VDDESNFDDKYTRNFLRKEISNIKKKYPSFVESILRLSRNAVEAEVFINKFVPEPVVCGNEVKIGIADLKEPAVGKRLILKACSLLNVLQDIEERHFEAVYSLIDCENGKKISLPHGIVVHKEQGQLVFVANSVKRIAYSEGKFEGLRSEATHNLSFVICHSSLNAPAIGNNLLIIKADCGEMKNAQKGVLFIDADKLPKGAVLRNRQEGDRIEKFGGGTKSLGDFLTDRKIPKRLRDSLVVCADGNEVYFVAGIEISEKVRVDGNTVNVARIEIEKRG